ncbi:hypothetical protein Hanom_Chr08g00701221 [Helianthus anomalus]
MPGVIGGGGGGGRFAAFFLNFFKKYRPTTGGLKSLVKRRLLGRLKYTSYPQQSHHLMPDQNPTCHPTNTGLKEHYI